VRVLVTGSSGFIGGHLVEHLLDAGDDVRVTDRQGPEGVDLCDADAARRLVKSARPEVVFHLAGFSDVAASWRDPIAAFQANAQATLCILLACRDESVEQVVVVSSADVYGAVEQGALPLGEDAPLRPASPYAASKVAAEYLAIQARVAGWSRAVCIRPFNQLGPGQSDRFVVPAMARQIALNERSGGEEVAVGNLSPRRDFTDVRDSVRALRLVVAQKSSGEVYNLCRGQDHAISELAEILLGLAARPMRLRTDPDRFRPVDLPVLRGDPTRLERATSWQPAVPLEHTLADVLEDWRHRVAAGNA
jgi:GDP-4-dehydro-6-deoxy-D-mannose reductase